jgi:hypothetical protein
MYPNRVEVRELLCGEFSRNHGVDGCVANASFKASTVTSFVETTQVAPTILQALGLDLVALTPCKRRVRQSCRDWVLSDPSFSLIGRGASQSGQPASLSRPIEVAKTTARKHWPVATRRLDGLA